MPEGDTIFRAATSLRRWLGGRHLTAAWSATFDAAPLVGCAVEEVAPIGKHLLIRLSGGLSVHTHMRMTGSWHVYPAGEKWCKPVQQARIVLEAGSHTAVCFNAPIVELLPTRDERRHPGLRALGPDVLVPVELDPDVVRARARSRQDRSPTVGELLLDQAVVAGIGNIYRCESLYLCRTDPWTPTAHLGDDALDALVATAARLMSANAHAPRTARRFEGGERSTWVYRRAGRPCRRCRTLVRRAELGYQARAVYWCPACQAPAARAGS